MIVGFDHDDTQIFQEQFDFLTEAGIAFTTAGILIALEHTPLHARLKAEGRLLDMRLEDMKGGHGAADLNFIPAGMTSEELLHGYNWLVRSLYSYENFADRLIRNINNFGGKGTRFEHNKMFLAPKFGAITKNILKYYLFSGDKKRRHFFWKVITGILHRPFNLRKFIEALSFMVIFKHFHEYVSEAHGDPETVSRFSPYTRRHPIPKQLEELADEPVMETTY
jgi:hypothetical protein